MPFSAGALFLCSATHKTSALGLSRSGTSYMVPSLALLASSHRRGHLLSHKSSFYLSFFLYFLCNSSQLLRCWSFLGVSCNLPPGYHAYRVICTPSYIYLSSYITSFGARVGCGVGDCRKKAKVRKNLPNAARSTKHVLVSCRKGTCMWFRTLIVHGIWGSGFRFSPERRST